jgi:hypothetical protein
LESVLWFLVPWLYILKNNLESHNWFGAISKNCPTPVLPINYRLLVGSLSLSHIAAISVIGQFVTNDNSFVLGFLCYCWLLFHEFSLHKVFIYFCSLFAFVFSLGCVYLCSHLSCTFAGWVPILDFYLQGFFFFFKKIIYATKVEIIHKKL